MFENFMAFASETHITDEQGDAIYLVIFNDEGYQNAIDWLNNFTESCGLPAKESAYYKYINGTYKPLFGVDDIPKALIDCFNEHKDTQSANTSPTPKPNISSIPGLYTVKLHLSDGTIIKPNYQSDNMLEFASIIEQLLTDELFNGQVEKIVID